MRADPSADDWEGVCFFDDLQGFAEVSCLGVSEVFLDVHVGRASGEAGCHAVCIMVGEQLLQADLSVVVEFFAVGGDDHPFADGGLAGFYIPLFGSGSEFDDAESAVAVGPVQADIVAKVRHIDAFLDQGL